MISNHVHINSVWKSLVPSCVHVAEVQALVFNAFVFSTKVFVSSKKCIRLFSSAKSACLQHKMHLLLAINALVCTVILYSEVSNRDYLETSFIWKLV